MAQVIEARRTPLAQFACLSVALNARDAYTENHCDRVKVLALQLGALCRLNARELVSLGDAAKLHDIGKIGIPDHILLKPGKFEPDEWETMKTHAELGQRVCESIPRREMSDVARIVRHHHEAYNGQGYPDRLSGEDIPISARIIAVADSYDAMATARPYHAPKSHDKVMAILDSEQGGRIDPYIFRHFARLIVNSPHRVA